MNVDPADFTAEALRKISPRCGCCEDGGDVDIAQGQIIYPNRSDLWAHADGYQRWWWLCNKCGGYVGTHKGTLHPLGSPADRETRKAREAAHAAFDPLWQRKIAKDGCTKMKARNAGYKWLAGQLGIDRKDCHIGMMGAAMALKVVDVVRNRPREAGHPT